MSNIQRKPWSDNPNAPKIPYDLYYAEKAYFAGILIASILYGVYMRDPETPSPARLLNRHEYARWVYSRHPHHALLPMHGLVV